MFERVFDYNRGMSAVLDLHPDPGHPGVVVAGVHEALDGLAGPGPLTLDPDEYAGVVTEVDRAVRRLQALKLKVVAAAARDDVPHQSGARSTGDWLSKQTRSGSAQGSRDAGLAESLDTDLPTTQAALEAGAIATEHATVVSHAMSRLPAGLTDQQRHTVEESLVRKATRLDPVQLRRVARRAIEAVEPDPRVVDAHEDHLVADEEDTARAQARITLHDHGDGTTSGHFRIPTLAAHILKKILDAMTAPRRTGRSGTRIDDWAHARGLAFADVLEHLPTDHLHHKVAATIVVTLDLDTLRGQLKAAGLDTGDLVSAAEARRLACQAALVPTVLDGPSLPLDLGRTKRLFNQTQRLAAATHHPTCAADGCDIPYAWCELHHRQPWAHGGQTNLTDLIPYCGHHHRRHHHDGTVPLRT